VSFDGASCECGDYGERRVLLCSDVGCELVGGGFEDFRLEGVGGEEGELGIGFVESRLALGEFLGAGGGKVRGT